jgi:hypothetical protein
MEEINEYPRIRLVKTVKSWSSARDLFSDFVAAHPELGLKDSAITFRNFCSRHGRMLMEQDVMRKPRGLRSPAIFDSERFDRIAFELITGGLTSPSDRTPAFVVK